MHTKFTVFCINVCLFLCLLIGVEVLGQTVYFLKTGRPMFMGKMIINDLLYERHPFLGTRIKKNMTLVKPEGTITTTDIGTRWTGAPDDDRESIRVVLLGGSSTFGSKTTDRDSWPALFQDMLGDEYAVINYGTPGYTTAENIIQMGLLVPEKDPDIVIVYSGWNDIATYHVPDLGPDYYAQGIKQMESNMENERFINIQWLRYQAKERIFLFKLAHVIRTKLERSDYDLPPGRGDPDPFVDRIYMRNLETLKNMILASRPDAQAVFVPQVLNYADFTDSKRARRWSPHITDAAMPKLLDRFNAMMTDVCEENETRCRVIKDVLNVNWQESDFMDDGHLSPQGGFKFAQVLAEKIKAME